MPNNPPNLTEVHAQSMDTAIQLKLVQQSVAKLQEDLLTLTDALNKHISGNGKKTRSDN